MWFLLQLARGFASSNSVVVHSINVGTISARFDRTFAMELAASFLIALRIPRLPPSTPVKFTVAW